MKLLFLFFLLAQFFYSYGKDKQNTTPITNLYFEWNYEDSSVILGHFSKNRLKRIPSFHCRIDQLSRSDIDNWLNNTGHGALLLFHCMWGQQPNFHKNKYLASIDKILTATNDVDITTEISFIWHAGGARYLYNYDLAATKGEPIGQAVYWIAEHYNGNAHVISHSMGSRFFEGVLRTMPVSEAPVFQNIMFFSSDIDNTTEDPDFMNCLHAADSVFVYIHRHDKFLLASSVMQGKNRLGKNGPDKPMPKLCVIDMTDHIAGIQNHTHIDKPWVQEQIRRNLSMQKNNTQ